MTYRRLMLTGAMGLLMTTIRTNLAQAQQYVFRDIDVPGALADTSVRMQRVVAAAERWVTPLADSGPLLQKFRRNTTMQRHISNPRAGNTVNFEQSDALRAESGLASTARLHIAYKIVAICAMFLVIAYAPAYADHVHHLGYNNVQWQDQDLTSLTGAPASTSFGAIAAFRTTPNNQLHVYYVDASASHVHQLYYNGTSWSDADLTAFTGGPQAYAYGISGFAIKNLQYVFYVGFDNHVHELSYNNSNWSDEDLTLLVGGNTANPAPLVAFITTPNDQFHVYYQDLNTLHEYQLYFNGSSWSYQDLTAIVGGAYCYADWIAGFSVGNLQHLFCAGYQPNSNELNLLHIHYNNFSWVYEDVVTAGQQMYLGAGVAAFKVPGVNQLEVFSVTANTHFDRFTHVVKPAQWLFNDLTNEIVAPTDGRFGQIVAFDTTLNNQYHIYYAPSTEVYQLYYNGTAWSVEDLTGGAGNADPNSGMAGFAIGNLQHVFYMSNN